MMAVGPDGSVYVTRPDQGDVVRLADRDGDGRADAPPQAVASNLKGVHGIAFQRDRLYLATVKEVYAAPLKGDGTLGEPRAIVKDLPDGGQHPKRTIGIGPDGLLYVSIGSTCNACVDTNDDAATIIRMAADGSGREVFARGLRNTIGFDWHPATHQLWGMDHGIDWMGNDDPPEELNRLEANADYGWPFVYADRRINELFDRPGVNKQEYAKTTNPPALTYQAHSAPIAMLFYTGAQFPADYKNDAIVAMHGSWNRSPASGYKVVRIHFNNGAPERFEDLLTGFLSADGKTQFGRPAGLAVLKDGSLLVSDDASGVIYRVSYSPPNRS
jgi:glucose/arabinose dehydrogenase